MVREYKYICTIKLDTKTSVKGKNYDDAITNAIYNITNKIKDSPKRFVEQNINDIKCYIVPNK